MRLIEKAFPVGLGAFAKEIGDNDQIMARLSYYNIAIEYETRLHIRFFIIDCDEK